MWNCPKCKVRNWQADSFCHNCGTSVSGDPPDVLSQRQSAGDDSYTFTLGPGIVRYLGVKQFLLAHEVEACIVILRQLASAEPKVNSPSSCFEGFKLSDADALALGESWENKLRIHHALGRFWCDHRVPSSAYFCFHRGLRLSEFALAECLEAWVKEAWRDADVTRSFLQSSEHLVLHHEAGDGTAVFRKTAFVLHRLASLAKVQDLEEQAEALERLQKSKFVTFVYVMEDLRNGCCKIGRSATPSTRERTPQSEVPEIVMRFSIPAEDNHEKHLHLHFAAKRMRPT